MSYGIVEYNQEGQPKCEICGRYFNRVISHVRQAHFINEREYKMLFGFDLIKGICSKESAEKTRIKTLGNYDKCIKNNLEIKGVKSRFVKKHKGRTKDKVSQQTRIMLKKRLKEPYVIEAMRKSGLGIGKLNLIQYNLERAKK